MTQAKPIPVKVPQFGMAAEPPDWRVPLAEYERRLVAVEAAMEREGLSHLAVYGDREHFANLAWLTGLDPRFEEALCLMTPGRKPALLLGNECLGYVPAAPLAQAGRLEIVRFTDFSLPGQVRHNSTLFDTLSDFGVEAHSRVGVAGWKTYRTPQEIDAPSYIVDALRFRAGWENVVNAVNLFIDNDLGFRTVASPEEIAYFEWTNTLASEGMKRVIAAIKPGARDFDLLEQARYNGVPLAAHMTLKCGANRVSLASARGERVVQGGRFSCGIAYWGANCCRCGWVAEGPADLPAAAMDYVEAFAGPYFAAMAAWFEALRIGGTGDDLDRAIRSRLPWETFHVLLNAGHLIHLDEWVNAPAYEGSQVRLRSGMVMQADVIPSHPDYYSSRMEDGYVLADAALQAALPEGVLARCKARREFMRQALGLPVGDDVLPLGNLCGVVQPFLLKPELAFALC
ncbi:MAG: hypothetical protein HZB13_22065 [Acidobacteria bacterium]|nr:hypothetical protein [Acidobacteriota bacterium]